MEIYAVRPGDTLYSVAKKYSVDLSRLAAVNQLADPSRLAVGSALVIPGYAEGALRPAEVNGYAYPNISAAVLNATLPYLTFFCPFSYSMTADGALIPIDDRPLVFSAYAANTAPMMTVTNIGSTGGFSGDIAHAVFMDEAVQNRVLDNILSTLREKKYYGINFNIEYIHPFDREGYNAFLRHAADMFHPLGYYLSTAIAPKTSDAQGGLLYEAHDYAAHGEYMDRVIVMTYEWGYTYSPPQAVSPVDRIRRVLEYAVTKIPAGMLLMGFSNYGYNWTLPWQQGEAAAVISSAAAADLAASVGAEVRYDAVAAAPYFYYTDPQERQHAVWYEDARSWQARLALAEEFDLAGISIWTVDKLYRPGLEVLGSTFSVEKIV